MPGHRRTFSCPPRVGARPLNCCVDCRPPPGARRSTRSREAFPVHRSSGGRRGIPLMI